MEHEKHFNIVYTGCIEVNRIGMTLSKIKLSTDPWGTLCCKMEYEFPIFTFCVLNFKKDSNHLYAMLVILISLC